jgi:hypothetical protein
MPKTNRKNKILNIEGNVIAVDFIRSIKTIELTTEEKEIRIKQSIDRINQVITETRNK